MSEEILSQTTTIPSTETSTRNQIETAFTIFSTDQTASSFEAASKTTAPTETSGQLASTTTASASSLSPAQDLACPTAQASYEYTDPETGNLYTIQCNTTYAGTVSEARVVPNMAACLESCSLDLECEAAGLDTSASQCAKYSALAYGTGTYSPRVQFAQLRIRAVVVDGVTSSFAVTSNTLTSTAVSCASFPLVSYSY